MLGEKNLSQPNRRRRHLDQFVILDVLKRLLERHPPRWLEENVAVATAGSHVGELLLLRGIDRHVVAAGVLAADHPLVDLVAGLDEEICPLLKTVEPEGHRLAGHHRHEHAIGPTGHLPFHLPPGLEAMVHDGGALGCVEHPRPQPDQTAGWDRERGVGKLAPRTHVLELAPAGTGELHNRPQLVVRHLNHERLEGLERRALLLPQDHPGLAHGDLEPLPPHGLDQNRKVEQATARNGKLLGARNRLNPQGNILFQLLVQPIAEVAGGQELARPADQRRGVDAKHHRKGRLVHRESGQRSGVGGVADGVADLDVFDPAHCGDVAGGGLLNIHSAKLVE